MAHDLLSPEEDAIAAAQGWGLHHIYELEVKQWVIRILPPAATDVVISLAKQNHPLPLKALRLMTHYKGR